MFYITPQWGELLNIKVWYAAVTQSFFSLSVGFGALFTYSSYNGFSHNVYRDALIISFTDTFTSLLAGKLRQYFQIGTNCVLLKLEIVSYIVERL